MTTRAILPRVIPLLHPLADLARRWRPTPDGDLEAEMTSTEALAAAKTLPTQQSIWWEIRNYSSAMYNLGRTAEALLFARRALVMKRCPATLYHIAVVLEALGKLEQSLDYITEAARIDPNDDRVTAFLAESLLRLGYYSQGWPWYIKNRASMDWCKMFLPEWEGPHQSLRGKRILVIEGGGYGDNIYFLRWLDTLRRWGADVHYVCQPSFAPLVRRQGFRAIENWSGNVDIVWSRYDYFCPLLSLGGKLGVTLENYRWRGPYIKADWRLPTPRVGLCYRAGEVKSPRKFRSLNDEQLNRILGSLPAHRWVNLTHGRGADLPHIHCPQLDSWLATANEISKLDLVVSVDTGVLHLAGAMGVPSMALLPGASAWLYPIGYDKHPLYPSMRIFRNYGEGLDEAVEDCAQELERLR